MTRKGRLAPNKGIPHTKETREKISKSCIKAGTGMWNKGRPGHRPWNVGIPRTLEDKEKMSRALKRYWKDRKNREQQQ